MESRRMQKVASLLKSAFSEVLQKHGPGIYGKAFVTLTAVKVTPDLSLARFYLSVYNVEPKNEVIGLMNFHKPELRKHLGNLLRHELRKVPQLEFFLDSTLDEAFRIDELLKNNPPKND